MELRYNQRRYQQQKTKTNHASICDRDKSQLCYIELNLQEVLMKASEAVDCQDVHSHTPHINETLLLTIK